MWSIGVVATTILTDMMPFCPSADASLPDAKQYAVKIQRLEKWQPWLDLNNAPRDFVRKLLILEESARLTAEKALQHKWVTDTRYCEAYNRVYKKATSRWNGIVS